MEIKPWFRPFDSKYGPLLAIVIQNELNFMLMVERELATYTHAFENEDEAMYALKELTTKHIDKFINQEVETTMH